MFVSLLLTQTHETSVRVPILFHCPACGERDVQGVAWTERQTTQVLELWQVMEERFDWVQGRCCGRRLLARAEPLILAIMDADEIQVHRLLVDRLSPVSITILIGAFVCACMPGLGLVMVLLAWVSSRCSRPWFRVALRVLLILHLLAMNAWFIAIVLSESK